MSTAEGKLNLADETVEVRQSRDFSDRKALIFRPEAGKTYRIHFISSDVEMRRRHYNPLKKRYFRCLEYQGFCPACLAASNKVGNIKGASDTFGANILLYETDANGQPTQPLNAEVAFWAFGSDKFAQIRSIAKEWGAADTLDLMVVCTDSQFQKVQISPARTCLYLTSGDEFKAACDQKIKDDSYPLDKFLCKEIPVVQMAQEFGLGMEYIPESFRQQMGLDTQTAQDMANNGTPASAPLMPTANLSPQPAPKPASLSPVPPQGNFQDISNITKLL